MTLKRFVWLVLALSWMPFGKEALVPSLQGARPNVLFLIADDLNCDLECYGHPMVQSPNINALAASGLRFENAYCQYPLCGPSRASFMAGMYPDQTRIHKNAIRIREKIPNVKTLSQHFMAHGYRAERIGKIYHYNVPADIGNDGHDDPDSWQQVFNPRGRDKDDEPIIHSLVPGKFGGTLSWLAADGEDAEQTDAIGAAEAERRLAAFAKEGTPFFLAVGMYRPHTPYVAPKAYFELYDRNRIEVPGVPEGYLDRLPKPAQKALTRKKDQLNLPQETAREVIQAYYASITFMDAQVGRLLQALDRLGLAGNTIVVMTSDHGYHMGEHGYWQKTTLFENATHVPLILRVPGRGVPGQSTASPVEMLDLYPTLASLCGLPAPERQVGQDLSSLLEHPGLEPRRGALTQYDSGYSIRTARWRYTSWGEGGKDGEELYDHNRDPEELNNLAGQPSHRAVQEDLARYLQERVREANQVPKGLKQLR